LRRIHSLLSGVYAYLAPTITSLTASVCSYAVPPVAYAYLGIESTAIAAYEAQKVRSIARPSQTIHWAVVLLYFLCTMGIALTVRWVDDRLPTIWGGPPIGTLSPSDPRSTSATVIAIWGRYVDLAGVVNGCLIFSILSSANTCLYISSRTMYGLTYHLRGTNPLSRYFKRTIGKVWPSTSVPAMALFFSVLLFYWLPFLLLAPAGSTIDAVCIGTLQNIMLHRLAHTLFQVIEILTLTASISCIITWVLLLIAYIRYERW
jgi:yeast amino acid transporter